MCKLLLDQREAKLRVSHADRSRGNGWWLAPAPVDVGTCRSTRLTGDRSRNWILNHVIDIYICIYIYHLSDASSNHTYLTIYIYRYDERNEHGANKKKVRGHSAKDKAGFELTTRS